MYSDTTVLYTCSSPANPSLLYMHVYVPCYSYQAPRFMLSQRYRAMHTTKRQYDNSDIYTFAPNADDVLIFLHNITLMAGRFPPEQCPRPEFASSSWSGTGIWCQVKPSNPSSC